MKMRLPIAFEKKEIDVKQQERMKVFDEDGTFLGLFKPDYWWMTG